MAGRRKVVEKDYDALIIAEEEKIVQLTSELKEAKATLKSLKKDKDKFNAWKAEEEKQRQIKEVAEIVISSGKSLEEIKELLSK